jgi:RNase P subunit RPR2
VTKDPSKIKQCPECHRLVEAATMRPLARTPSGGRVRVACPGCYTRVMELRKAVAGRR